MGRSIDDLVAQHRELQFAKQVSHWISKQLMPDRELVHRFRFVTALDLYPIFHRLNALEAEHLRWWFIGPTRDIRYDTPKIIEAIVRLRLLGNGVPVFRLDWDVLLRGENSDVADLGLFKAVACCLRAYRLRLDEATVATFMFSASYDTRALADPATRDTFAAWRGAFATRVFPALPVVTDLLTAVRKEEITWEEYANRAFNVNLARRFYGFKDEWLRLDGVDGLVSLGAHPRVSVVSGAFLCLSEGAIIDLPPFSNFGLNVSWIDDHLKYSLHRELRHLTSVNLQIEPLLSDAKLDDVMVQKARGTIANLPTYVLGEYLPTLLWGAIMDAWITPDPLLKCRSSELRLDLRDTWKTLQRNGLSAAPLPEALQDALRAGHLRPHVRFLLKDLLQQVALKRINAVRRQWSSLMGFGCETFASIWAKGIVKEYFPEIPERCHGIAPQTPMAQELQDIAEINRFLRSDFDRVVEDALEYIGWTLEWPRIVQVVRSIEQGTLRTDMSWRLSAISSDSSQ